MARLIIGATYFICSILIYHFASLFGGSVQAKAFIAIAALSSFGLYGLYLAIFYLEHIFTRWKTEVHSTLLHEAILHIVENEVTIHLILAPHNISFISFKKAFAQVDKMKVYKIFFYNSQEHLWRCSWNWTTLVD